MCGWTYVVQFNTDNIFIGSSRILNYEYIYNEIFNYFNTSKFIILGVYNTSANVTFFEYTQHIEKSKSIFNPFLLYDWNDNYKCVILENYLYYLYCKLKKSSKKIYTSVNINSNIVGKRKFNKKLINTRLLCDCGIPCEVNKNKFNIYFECCKKNIKNKLFKNTTYCNFYKEYTKDNIKIKRYLAFESLYYDNRQEPWVKNIPEHTSENNCLHCNILKYDLVYAHGKYRSICKQCFTQNFNKIKKMYKEKTII